MNQAGVAGSPGTWLHLELQALVNDGLTPLQALQAATYSAELYMARLDKYGVVEPGHIADMVLLESTRRHSQHGKNCRRDSAGDVLFTGGA